MPATGDVDFAVPSVSKPTAAGGTEVTAASVTCPCDAVDDLLGTVLVRAGNSVGMVTTGWVPADRA